MLKIRHWGAPGGKGKKSKRTLYPEVYVLSAETNVVYHFAAVHSRVVALQRASESKAIVWLLNTLGHQSIQPVQKWNIKWTSERAVHHTQRLRRNTSHVHCMFTGGMGKPVHDLKWCHCCVDYSTQQWHHYHRITWLRIWAEYTFISRGGKVFYSNTNFQRQGRKITRLAVSTLLVLPVQMRSFFLFLRQNDAKELQIGKCCSDAWTIWNLLFIAGSLPDRGSSAFDSSSVQTPKVMLEVIYRQNRLCLAT